MIGFVCAIPLISALFSDCAAPPPFATGYVEGEYVLIAPLASAQVLELPVGRGDRVAAGQGAPPPARLSDVFQWLSARPLVGSQGL